MSESPHAPRTLPTPTPATIPIALTIAGSDPSGGAGLQADLKTFAAHGVYGASVISLITVQNTCGVRAVEGLSVALVRQQIDAVLSDLDVHAVKIGALLDGAIIQAVADGLRAYPARPLVVDPVMVSKHGDALLRAHEEACLRDELLPLATLITPNRHEARRLLNEEGPWTHAQTLDAAQRLHARFGCAVLITGGGKPSDEDRDDQIVDWLVIEGKGETLVNPRVAGHHQHGAGCTIAAAITANLARWANAAPANATPANASRATNAAELAEAQRVALPPEVLRTAVLHARAYVQRAMRAAPSIGHGEGPLWHGVSPTPSPTEDV